MITNIRRALLALLVLALVVGASIPAAVQWRHTFEARAELARATAELAQETANLQATTAAIHEDCTGSFRMTTPPGRPVAPATNSQVSAINFQDPPSSPAWDGRSLAVFGDSLATGYGLAYGGNAYPDRLRDALRGDPPTSDGTPTVVYNYAINGATVADYLPGGRWYESSPVWWWSGRGMVEEFGRNQVGLAIIALGLNEYASFNPPVPAATYRANLEALSANLRARNPGAKILYVHEPGVQPWKSDLWRQYWDAQRSVAQQFGPNTSYLDWSAVLPWGTQPWPGFSYFQADQVHPNDAGQVAMGAVLITHIRGL